MSNIVALIIAIAAFVLVWALPAAAVGHIATRRGRRFWPWFLLAFLVSWLLAAVALFVSRDLSEPDGNVEQLKQRLDALEQAEAARKAGDADLPIAPRPSFMQPPPP